MVYLKTDYMRYKNNLSLAHSIGQVLTTLPKEARKYTKRLQQTNKKSKAK